MEIYSSLKYSSDRKRWHPSREEENEQTVVQISRRPLVRRTISFSLIDNCVFWSCSMSSGRNAKRKQIDISSILVDHNEQTFQYDRILLVNTLIMYFKWFVNREKMKIKVFALINQQIFIDDAIQRSPINISVETDAFFMIIWKEQEKALDQSRYASVLHLLFAFSRHSSSHQSVPVWTTTIKLHISPIRALHRPTGVLHLRFFLFLFLFLFISRLYAFRETKAKTTKKEKRKKNPSIHRRERSTHIDIHSVANYRDRWSSLLSLFFLVLLLFDVLCCEDLVEFFTKAAQWVRTYA